MKVKTRLWDGLILLIIASFLIIPLALTFLYSVFTEWMDILPTGFTLSFYSEIFSDGAFINSLLRSIVISFVPVLICTIAILLVLYVITLYMPKLEKYVEILCNIPYAIQGVILAVGVISLYSGRPGFLSNRIFLLVGAYCIIILPYTYRGLKNTIGALNVRCVIEAAQVLGCSKIHAFFAIVIPQKAIVQRQGKQFVIKVENIKNGVGQPKFTPVDLGINMGNYFLVNSGLNAGDVIVVEGSNKVYSEKTPVMDVQTMQQNMANQKPQGK